MWIKGQVDSYIPPIKKHNPREIILVVDATFYARKKDRIGTLVFKDNLTKEILIWKHICIAYWYIFGLHLTKAT